MLRRRGLTLAVITLAFGLATTAWLLSPRVFGEGTRFDWLPPARVERPDLFGVIDVGSETRFYFLCLAALALVVVAVVGIRRSRTGRALVAIRENERAASAFGVNPRTTTLQAFAMSGFLAAFAGALFVHQQNGLQLDSYGAGESLVVFTMVVIGGLGSVPGALLGALFVRGVTWWLPVEWQILATGAGMLVVLLVFRGGFGAAFADARDALLRRVARRRGIAVPSLTGTVLPRHLPTPAPPAAPTDACLQVRSLAVERDGVPVLERIDLDARAGEIVALLGTNGSGKSTLLDTVAGVQRSSGGHVTIDGVDTTRTRAERLVGLGVAEAPADHGVFPTLTVRENLRLAVWRTRDRAASRASLAAALELFPRLDERAAAARRRPLGRRAAHADAGHGAGRGTPTPPGRRAVPRSGARSHPPRAGATPNVARRGCRDRGRRAVDRPGDRARRSRGVPRRRHRPLHGLAARTPRPARPRAGDVPRRGRGRHVDTRARTAARPCSHPTRRPALALRDVRVRFGGVVALDGVSLTVARGEIVGVIGPNGAGKTTLFDTVSGFTRPDAGTIELRVDGDGDGDAVPVARDVTRLAPHARATLGLGRSFQDGRLFPALDRARDDRGRVRARGARPQPGRRRTAPSRGRRAPKPRWPSRVDELVERLHLEPFADRFGHELSTGTRRIVDLACVLAHEPSVLLLDEPAAGIAQREAEALGPLLTEVRDSLDAAVLVVEHDLGVLGDVADRIVALDRGRVVAVGPPEVVLTDPDVVGGPSAPDPPSP